MDTRITTKEAAKFVSISEQRIRTLCRTGVIRGKKIKNVWSVDVDSLQEFGLKSGRILADDRPISAVDRSKPVALSFFSGAMGLDIGIEQAGFDIRLACEVDKYGRQTIELNKPNIALLGDINEYTAADIRREAGLLEKEEIDLIAGGPPCQAFSTAGKRKGFSDDRGNVFLRYLEICLELKPKYFVIENVRGLLSCPMDHRPHNQRGSDFPDLSEDELKGGALNFVLNRLEKSGYGYSFNLYNSANFGTPQIRERVIIICSRTGDKPPYLEPTHSKNTSHGLPKWNDLRSCLRGIKTHDHLTFPEKRLRYYRLLKSGQNWRNLPSDLQKEAMGNSFYAGGGKTGFYRRLAWDKPSPTLVTHPAMPATDLAHPTADRPLSVQEYMRIQQFPDTWKLAGPIIQRYKQIGNAVPIGLGYAVGKTIIQLLSGNRPKNEYINFPYSRYKSTNDKQWQDDFKKRVANHRSTLQQLKLSYD